MCELGTIVDKRDKTKFLDYRIQRWNHIDWIVYEWDMTKFLAYQIQKWNEGGSIMKKCNEGGSIMKFYGFNQHSNSQVSNKSPKRRKSNDPYLAFEKISNGENTQSILEFGKSISS